MPKPSASSCRAFASRQVPGAFPPGRREGECGAAFKPKHNMGGSPRPLLLWAVVLGVVALSCGYRFVGTNPGTLACMLPVENFSNEVGAGQVFDAALRSRLGKAGGGETPLPEGSLGGQACLNARLRQISQSHLSSYEGRVTQFRLTAVVELRLEGFKPIQVVESEDFGHGADILLTEASLRAALARLADKTAQKAFEHMQMQWLP